LKKKLLCLNVELLKDFDRTKVVHSYSIPSPKYCSAFVTPSLIETLSNALRLIEDNGLIEIVYSVSEVNWFNSLDDRIYPSINSSLHISKKCIYYSGAFAPDTSPAFVSTRLHISSITLDEQQAPKHLNLSFLSTDIAKALIAEIETLDSEMQVAWGRQESLEELDTALDGLNSGSILASASNTNALAYEVSIEIKQLAQQTEALEREIEKKCEILCKRVLNIAIGDRVVTQSQRRNNHQEIQIESVRYYNGTMYLDGIRVLKTGALGKRSETAYITLVPDNEHQ
jgi:hypothetical protein